MAEIWTETNNDDYVSSTYDYLIYKDLEDNDYLKSSYISRSVSLEEFISNVLEEESVPEPDMAIALGAVGLNEVRHNQL